MPRRDLSPPGQFARRLATLACAAGLLAPFTAGASADDDVPWTPALLIDSSPAFRPRPQFLLTQADGETQPATPDQTEPESIDSDLLGGFNEATNTPVKTPVESFEAPVTSLTLSPSTVGKSPAAVFVIDQEMIRRSGAQTLPEVLRMAPGVHVGVGNGTTPNVSIRGFGFGNSLPFSSRVLVLIDGRSIYDPIIGGVLWNPNDVVLQDVERIEVIRGPGATIWGANATGGWSRFFETQLFAGMRGGATSWGRMAAQVESSSQSISAIRPQPPRRHSSHWRTSRQWHPPGEPGTSVTGV